MKTPPNLEPNLTRAPPALGEESAFPVTPRPLEFAANSGRGFFKSLNVASMQGCVKGINLPFFPPCNGVI